MNSKPENYNITELDKVSADENLKLFDILTYKMTDTVLKVKFGDMGVKIASHRDALKNWILENNVLFLQKYSKSYIVMLF